MLLYMIFWQTILETGFIPSFDFWSVFNGLKNMYSAALFLSFSVGRFRAKDMFQIDCER